MHDDQNSFLRSEHTKLLIVIQIAQFPKFINVG